MQIEPGMKVRLKAYMEEDRRGTVALSLNASAGPHSKRQYVGQVAEVTFCAERDVDVRTDDGFVWAWPTSACEPVAEPTQRLRIYIAGPMLGREGFNFKAFHDAARELRALGHFVTNPAELDELQGSLPTEAMAEALWPQYMKRDIPLLAECDAIYMLPGWETSVGATLEFLSAFHMGIPVYTPGAPLVGALNAIDIRDIGRVALTAARSIVQTMTANWGNGNHHRGEWRTEDPSSHLLKASRHALTAEGQRRPEAKFKQDGEDHAAQALCRAAMAVAQKGLR